MIKEITYRNIKVNFNIINEFEHIQKHWLKGYFYENDMLNYIRDNYDSGLNYIDCGGCIGNHTIFFSKIMQASKVIVFEPVIELYTQLLNNLILNNITNVLTINKALLNKAGISFMDLSNFNENIGMSKINESGHYRINTTKLDLYAYQKVDILKIDCEGNNEKILQGANELLSEQKPDIFIECDNDFKSVETILNSYQYKYTGKQFNRTPTYLFSAK